MFTSDTAVTYLHTSWFRVFASRCGHVYIYNVTHAYILYSCAEYRESRQHKTGRKIIQSFFFHTARRSLVIQLNQQSRFLFFIDHSHFVSSDPAVVAKRILRDLRWRSRQSAFSRARRSKELCSSNKRWDVFLFSTFHSRCTRKDRKAFIFPISLLSLFSISWVALYYFCLSTFCFLYSSFVVLFCVFNLSVCH